MQSHFAIVVRALVGVVAVSIQAEASDLYVSAASANSVMRFDGQTGAFLGNFVAPGSGGLGDPQGIAFGPDGNLYVASNASDNILRYNGQTGAFIDVFVTPGMAWPAEINFRGDHLYVSDFAGNRVARFNSITGAFVDNFATGLQGADGQTWDSAGNLLVSSWGDNSVKRFNGVTGALIGNFVSPNAGALNGPLDSLFLPGGQFLVSSFNNGRVKAYSSNGIYLGDFGLPGPQGLQIGPDGLLYAGSFVNGQINRYNAQTLLFHSAFANAGGAMTNNFVFGPAIPEPSTTVLLGIPFALRRRRLSRRNGTGQTVVNRSQDD